MEGRARIGAAAKERIGGILKAQGSRGSTSIEIKLYSLLGAAYGVGNFERQYQVGSYVADAFTPEDQIAWEADGAYWHRDSEEKDQRRDAELLNSGQVSAVVRLGEYELRQLEV